MIKVDKISNWTHLQRKFDYKLVAPWAESDAALSSYFVNNFGSYLLGYLGDGTTVSFNSDKSTNEIWVFDILERGYGGRDTYYLSISPEIIRMALHWDVAEKLYNNCLYTLRGW